jgi:predicted secreted protein
MRTPATLIALAFVAFGAVACSSSGSADGATTGDDAEVRSTLQIDSAQKGKTVDVPHGAGFTIKLASNGTTGYSWSVSDEDGLAAPTSKYVAPSSHAAGASGMQYFTFKTTSKNVGKHHIKLIYQRPWAETSPPVDTFNVTIDVTDGGPKCGDGPACGSGSSCQGCWGHLACVPTGAMC